MATWNDLVGYVRSRYKISDEKPNMIKLVFEVGDNRTQVVVLWYVTLDNGREQWVQIESPFGELGTLNLSHALQEVQNTVCGGMALVGNLVTFRHSVPLENMDINEFERPLVLVTSTADNLERQLTGGDAY